MTENYDYTNRDYLSIRSDMLARAQLVLPEWRSQDPADFGVLIMEALARELDNLHYYIDRAANEAFLSSALRRRSVLAIAEMLDYTPSPRTAASATVTFTRATGVSGPVTVPVGTVIASSSADGDSPIYFQTTLPLTLANGVNSGDVTAEEGLSVVEELLGSSVGVSNQEFLLGYVGIYEASVQLFVLEGALDVYSQPAPVEWRKVERMVEVDSLQGAFVVRTDDGDSTYIQLGDGVTGRIPSVNTLLKATYRYGVGSSGNVGPGTLTVLSSNVPGIGSVTNAAAATGGGDTESIESMRTSIPQAFGSQDRGVTATDYRSLALQVPGVTKANSIYGIDDGGGTAGEIRVSVAPNTATAPSAALKTTVDDALTARGMAGHSVTMVDPVFVGVNFTATIAVFPQYVRQWVVADCLTAVQSLLAYQAVDYADTVKLGEMYRALFAVRGVDTVTITVLSRTGTGVGDVVMTWKEIPKEGTLTLTGTGGIVV